MPKPKRELSDRPPIRFHPDRDVCDWIEKQAQEQDRPRTYIVHQLLKQAMKKEQATKGASQ